MAENYESFFERIKPKFSGKDFELIDAAYEFAKEGHGYFGQMRESGERYFEHPRAVALIVMDELGIFDRNTIIACLFHDMNEDCLLLRNRRIKLFFGKETQRVVDLLTKPEKSDGRFSAKSEKLAWYFNRIMRSDWKTKVVKLADRLHNLRTLKNCSEEKYHKQIAETRKYFIPLIDDLRKEHPKIAEFFKREFKKFIGRWEVRIW